MKGTDTVICIAVISALVMCISRYRAAWAALWILIIME